MERGSAVSSTSANSSHGKTDVKISRSKETSDLLKLEDQENQTRDLLVSDFLPINFQKY